MGLSPSWAFSGQAVDGVGDAHLAAGVHYRVLTHPLLGLPVVPLVIGRITLGQWAKGFTRRDVLWVDSRNAVLTAPFTVTPDNPVVGFLPAGQTCCWAALEASPARDGRPPLPGRPPVVGTLERRGGPSVRVVVSPSFPRPTAPVDFGVVRPGRPGRQASLRFEGVVTTPFGDAPVAVRSSAPYHVYASHLERLVVRGSGWVTGLSWLPAAAVERFEKFRTAPLPTSSGVRYAGPADGKDQSFERVERGAPQRFGMHESPLAGSPTACSPVGAGDEIDRVSALTVEPATSLDRLVNDPSAPQRLLTSTENVVDQNGNSLGTSDRFVLMDLLQGVVDPGIARWLGFLDVDEEVPAEQVVVAYVVDALFAPDWRQIQEELLDGTFAAGSLTDDGAAAVRRLAQLAPELERLVDEVGGMDGPFLHQRAVLAATANAPLDPPSAPLLGTPESGDWMPAPAPTAVREITMDLENLVPGAGTASAIAQPAGGTPVERNTKDTLGRRLLLTPRAAPGAATATSGVLVDRLADERAGSWQIAQTDWFGRWSTRSMRNFGAAARPRPPRPTFTLTTRPPAVTTSTGPLAGVVRIEVSVPPVAGLPSGGRLLDHLELTVTADGGPTVSAHPLPVPSAPPEVLVIEVPGPELLPTASGTVIVTGIWRDTANVASDGSEPKSATLHDPRPPSPVVIPPTLTYTARPDATGRARVSLRWNPTTGQASYRVFVADETTLRAKLEDVAGGTLSEGDAGQAPSTAQAQSLLSTLDAAIDTPARGAVWDASRQLLPRRWWLQLTAEPLPRPASGPATFTHDVSGSLSVLVLYRVVAVSAASVESDFRSCPLLPRAVPNQLTPPVPTLQVLPVLGPAGELQAQLTVTVPPGPTPAVQYRLRRASAASDPALMQLVGGGPVPPRPAGDAAPQVFTVLDTGSSPSGPRTSLPAWQQYTWRIEVQGPPAPGGGPVGEWSTPSAPVSSSILPPDPPAPVADVAITRDAAGVHVRFTHPEPLAGGATVGYVVAVYRQLAGSQLRLLTSLPGQAPPPEGRGADVTGFFDVVDNDVEALPGTLYRVVVSDPIGRASTPSDPQEAP